MKRRLYFLLPDSGHTRAVVNDLKVFGINADAMHTLAQPGVDLSGLPVATRRQRVDSGARLETILWDGNLTIYFESEETKMEYVNTPVNHPYEHSISNPSDDIGRGG